MRTEHLIAWGIGGAIAYNLIAKGTALGRLNFYPDTIRGIAMDGATPVMTVGLTVQNTSNQKMILRSFAGNLYTNDKLIGNVSSFSPIEINPNTQGVLLINAKMSLLGIVNEIIRAIEHGIGSYDIELDGFANVDRYQVPVKLKYKIGS